MTKLSANLRLRPIRIGFLVDPSDLSSLREVMRLSCCLWGGIYNPIIPVCASLPDAWTRPIPEIAPSSVRLTKGYIDFFEPDIYVEAKPGISQGLDIPEGHFRMGSKRVSSLQDLYSEADPRMGLSVLDVYRDLFDRDFRFVPRHPARVALFAGSAAADQPFVDCVLGSLSK